MLHNIPHPRMVSLIYGEAYDWQFFLEDDFLLFYEALLLKKRNMKNER